jgi:hypothetical protein
MSLYTDLCYCAGTVLLEQPFPVFVLPPSANCNSDCLCQQSALHSTVMSVKLARQFKLPILQTADIQQTIKQTNRSGTKCCSLHLHLLTLLICRLRLWSSKVRELQSLLRDMSQNTAHAEAAPLMRYSSLTLKVMNEFVLSRLGCIVVSACSQARSGADQHQGILRWNPVQG